MEKANVTLYTVIGDSNRIVEAIRERFKEMTKEFVCEDETIDLTLPDGTHVIFSIKHRMSKPDFIASHISGMANYFSQVKTPLVGLKENVLLQIRVFNCVTGITFDLNDNEDRTNYILNRLFEIAGDVNGFLLYPSMHWTGTTRKKLRLMWKDVCVRLRCSKRNISLIWNICVVKHWKVKPI